MHTHVHACICTCAYTTLSLIFSLRTAAELLEKGARTGIKDDNGNAPLHYATLYGHLESVKLLINNQADIDAVYVKLCTCKSTCVTKCL